MPTAPSTARKTELSPIEAIVVEHALGVEARQNTRDGTLARIQQLTRDRQKLYSRASAHPLLAASQGAQIRAIGAEIERLWDLLRRERATRRVQIERALNVIDEEADEANEDTASHMQREHRSHSGSSDAA